MEKIHSTFSELEEGDVESTSMGASGIDVKLSPRARKLLPLSIECKSHEKFAVYTFYEQAKSNTVKGTYPAVVIKQNRSEPLIIMSLEDYLNDRKPSS